MTTSIGLTVDEFLSAFEGNQHLALVSHDKVLWVGTADKLPTSSLYDYLKNATIKNLEMSKTLFNTFLGGVSQNWMGMLIHI